MSYHFPFEVNTANKGIPIPTVWCKYVRSLLNIEISCGNRIQFLNLLRYTCCEILRQRQNIDMNFICFIKIKNVKSCVGGKTFWCLANVLRTLEKNDFLNCYIHFAWGILNPTLHYICQIYLKYLMAIKLQLFPLMVLKYILLKRNTNS